MTDLVRVTPVDGPVDATVRLPGSKSITIRALTTAALANGRSHIYGGLEADDSAAMIGVLREFGVSTEQVSEPWTVDGKGGHLHAESGTVDAKESGLTARIALGLAAFTETSTTVMGRGRLLQRPIDALVDVLQSQGVPVHTSNGFLPATVSGQGGLWGGDITVDCSKSSQFATAVLLVSPLMTEPARVRLSGLAGSSGYLDSTLAVMEAFGASVERTITGFETSPSGYSPADYPVEPDASAAVYPMAAAAITAGQVRIPGLRLGTTQPDIAISRHLTAMGCLVTDTEEGLTVSGPDQLHPIDANLSDAPDGALGLAVVCAFAQGPSRLSGLHSLKYKESDRLASLARGLRRIGAAVELGEDSLTIGPGPLRAAVIDPHGDHRIAMSLAIAGLRVPGVDVESPAVVAKTWPGFWEMLTNLGRKTPGNHSSGVPAR